MMRTRHMGAFFNLTRTDCPGLEALHDCHRVDREARCLAKIHKRSIMERS